MNNSVSGAKTNCTAKAKLYAIHQQRLRFQGNSLSYNQNHHHWLKSPSVVRTACQHPPLDRGEKNVAQVIAKESFHDPCAVRAPTTDHVNDERYVVLLLNGTTRALVLTTLLTSTQHSLKWRNPAAAYNGARPLTDREFTSMAETDIPTVILSYKYRLRPTRQQHERLEAILESQRQLYNGALEHRIGAYRKGVSISLYQQMLELTELRKCADFGRIPANLQRWTLRRLEFGYNRFFSQLKRREKVVSQFEI